MRVSKETLQRTLEAARQIDFHPNVLDQRLIAVQICNVNGDEDAQAVRDEFHRDLVTIATEAPQGLGGRLPTEQHNFWSSRGTPTHPESIAPVSLNAHRSPNT